MQGTGSADIETGYNARDSVIIWLIVLDQKIWPSDFMRCWRHVKRDSMSILPHVGRYRAGLGRIVKTRTKIPLAMVYTV